MPGPPQINGNTHISTTSDAGSQFSLGVDGEAWLEDGRFRHSPGPAETDEDKAEAIIPWRETTSIFERVESDEAFT